MAHLILSVRRWEQTTAWYRGLLGSLGFTLVADTDAGLGSYDHTPTSTGFVYLVGGRTGIGFHRAAEGAPPAVQGAPGLHHWCLRARSRRVVDGVAAVFRERLRRIGGRIVRAPGEGGWAPGYYSILLEDPDGMRVEVNHVPGRGLLAAGGGAVGNRVLGTSRL